MSDLFGKKPTINTPGLRLGAYDPHDPGHRIGPFSSVGPTRDGRLKPDLCAPGVSVLAARSARRDKPDDTPPCTRMSGTSMAAPHVAGALALAFQAAVRPLRIEETHKLLLGTARRVTVQDRDPDRIGIGFLDIAALVEAAGKVSQRTFTPVKELAGATPAPAAVPAQGEGLVPQVEIENESIDAEVDLGGRMKRGGDLVSTPTPIESMEQEAVSEQTPPEQIPETENVAEVAETSAETSSEWIPSEREYLDQLGVGDGDWSPAETGQEWETSPAWETNIEVVAETASEQAFAAAEAAFDLEHSAAAELVEYSETGFVESTPPAVPACQHVVVRGRPRIRAERWAR